MPLNLTKLRTLRQFTEENPAFTSDYMHYLISKADQNGIEDCLVRVGAKIFVDTEAFADWLQHQPHAHTRGGQNRWTKRATWGARTEAVNP